MSIIIFHLWHAHTPEFTETVNTARNILLQGALFKVLRLNIRWEVLFHHLISPLPLVRRLSKMLPKIFPYLLVNFTTTKRKESQARIPFLCDGLSLLCWGLSGLWLCWECWGFWILSVYPLSAGKQFPAASNSVLRSHISEGKAWESTLLFSSYSWEKLSWLNGSGRPTEQRLGVYVQIINLAFWFWDDSRSTCSHKKEYRDLTYPFPVSPSGNIFKAVVPALQPGLVALIQSTRLIQMCLVFTWVYVCLAWSNLSFAWHCVSTTTAKIQNNFITTGIPHAL